MARRLERKIAIVTSNTTGISFATTKRFATEDTQILVMGRR